MEINIIDGQTLPDGQVGKVAYVDNSEDLICIHPPISLIADQPYCFTLWVKQLDEGDKKIRIEEGTADTVFDGLIRNQWKRIVLSFNSDGNELYISLDPGRYHLFKAQLENGRIPSDWKQSEYDEENELVELERRVNTLMVQTSEGIIQSVEENYYAKGETDELLSSVWTKFEEDSTSFEMQFGMLNKDLTDLSNQTDARYEEQTKYIRFENGNIILGELENELTLKIQKDRISFIEDGTEVAYFSNNKLYVQDGEFLSTLQLGSFAFTPRETGNLSLVKLR